ncbi:YolD-like protein [Paenibacillus cellulosilyticus]|uniref:YolD-like protein n=1 Tax=Paenibacillus cellulosilyticus TaxID=375489 RepID=A0A2V2YXB2_9BACL|nr:YolD-like family protein [Paenibacillus cellulosilyticus]PWW06254.1 YolD-like protein [Paenibacillus cellulosilyticus]QKS42993.1 YolD-like family protein [Paenibacillus cellulosilyticus]
MSKKLQGNGLWESSRMMLPEHKLELINSAKELKRRAPVELDEHEWEQIERLMMESHQLRHPIELRMYHPYEETKVIGIVDRVDSYRGRFMVDGEWFDMRHIEGAERESGEVD